MHTTRSMEIPALGGLLCAERTTEHLEFYEEGKEAIFLDNAEDCAVLCQELLSEESRRKNITQRRYDRAIKNGYYNEQIMTNFIDETVAVLRPR